MQSEVAHLSTQQPLMAPCTKRAQSCPKSEFVNVPTFQIMSGIQARVPAKQNNRDEREPVINFLQESPVSDAFFSNANMKIIQDQIREGVYDKSNKQYIIAPQNYGVLKRIMRGIYLMYLPEITNGGRITAEVIGVNQPSIEPPCERSNSRPTSNDPTQMESNKSKSDSHAPKSVKFSVSAECEPASILSMHNAQTRAARLFIVRMNEKVINYCVRQLYQTARLKSSLLNPDDRQRAIADSLNYPVATNIAGSYVRKLEL